MKKAVPASIARTFFVAIHRGEDGNAERPESADRETADFSQDDGFFE